MPDVSLVHIDQYLTDFSVGYQNFDFVGRQIYKPKFEDRQSNRYPVFGFERFKQYRTERGPGGEAPEAPPWKLSNDNFFCAGKGQKSLIADEVRGNTDLPDIDVETTSLLSDIIWLQHEIAVFNAIFGAGASVANTTLSGTSQWSDFQNSDPIAAVNAQKPVIEKAVGKTPNTLVVSKPVHLQLIQHPIILDRFKFGNLPTGVPVNQQLRSVFEVDNYLIANAIYDTANVGQAASTNYVWGKNALLAYISPEMGRRIVTLGATFMWTYGVPNNEGLLVKRYRDESRTGDWIEYQAWYDLKTIVAAAAYAWINAVA